MNSDSVSNNYRTTINNYEENESIIDRNKLYKDIEQLEGIKDSEQA